VLSKALFKVVDDSGLEYPDVLLLGKHLHCQGRHRYDDLQ
jgi:hypothetical protein